MPISYGHCLTVLSAVANQTISIVLFVGPCDEKPYATHDGRLRHFVCNVAVIFSLMSLHFCNITLLWLFLHLFNFGVLQ